MRLSTMQASSNFNPRSPHGERPASYCPCPCQQRFQSTLPARGATMSTRRSAFAESAFQSTLPARGATVVPSSSAVSTTFQSTLPARGATTADSAEPKSIEISIHAPRTGSDCPPHTPQAVVLSISIHAPRTGSDDDPFDMVEQIEISIHAPRTGSDMVISAISGTIAISIHAPRTGSDPTTKLPIPGLYDFNPRSPHGERLFRLIAIFGHCRISIHAPRTGSDGFDRRAKRTGKAFQSTLPARGATASTVVPSARARHFNPRSPHGERRFDRRAKRTGKAFQSTLPARGATFSRLLQNLRDSISIHAPRTGSDVSAIVADPLKIHFNPRSPHGERLNGRGRQEMPQLFQSTLPARGATRNCPVKLGRICISIHAPRTGSDILCGDCVDAHLDFNPRSPHGERLDRLIGREKDAPGFQSTLPARGATYSLSELMMRHNISIHAPRTGSDGVRAVCGSVYRISIHAPRTGSDGKDNDDLSKELFQSTLPARGATRDVHRL